MLSVAFIHLSFIVDTDILIFFIAFYSYIIIFCNCGYRVAKSISPKSIFSHITSTFLNFTRFIIFSDFLCIFCSLIFKCCWQNIFFTTSRIYSACGLVKFPCNLSSVQIYVSSCCALYKCSASNAQQFVIIPFPACL